MYTSALTQAKEKPNLRYLWKSNTLVIYQFGLNCHCPQGVGLVVVANFTAAVTGFVQRPLVDFFFTVQLPEEAWAEGGVQQTSAFTDWMLLFTTRRHQTFLRGWRPFPNFQFKHQLQIPRIWRQLQTFYLGLQGSNDAHMSYQGKKNIPKITVSDLMSSISV